MTRLVDLDAFVGLVSLPFQLELKGAGAAGEQLPARLPAFVEGLGGGQAPHLAKEGATETGEDEASLAAASIHTGGYLMQIYGAWLALVSAFDRDGLEQVWRGLGRWLEERTQPLAQAQSLEHDLRRWWLNEQRKTSHAKKDYPALFRTAVARLLIGLMLEESSGTPASSAEDAAMQRFERLLERSSAAQLLRESGGDTGENAYASCVDAYGAWLRCSAAMHDLLFALDRDTKNNDAWLKHLVLTRSRHSGRHRDQHHQHFQTLFNTWVYGHRRDEVTGGLGDAPSEPRDLDRKEARAGRPTVHAAAPGLCLGALNLHLCARPGSPIRWSDVLTAMLFRLGIWAPAPIAGAAMDNDIITLHKMPVGQLLLQWAEEQTPSPRPMAEWLDALHRGLEAAITAATGRPSERNEAPAAPKGLRLVTPAPARAVKPQPEPAGQPAKRPTSGRADPPVATSHLRPSGVPTRAPRDLLSAEARAGASQVARALSQALMDHRENFAQYGVMPSLQLLSLFRRHFFEWVQLRLDGGAPFGAVPLSAVAQQQTGRARLTSLNLPLRLTHGFPGQAHEIHSAYAFVHEDSAAGTLAERATEALSSWSYRSSAGLTQIRGATLFNTVAAALVHDETPGLLNPEYYQPLGPAIDAYTRLPSATRQALSPPQQVPGWLRRLGLPIEPGLERLTLEDFETRCSDRGLSSPLKALWVGSFFEMLEQFIGAVGREEARALGLARRLEPRLRPSPGLRAPDPVRPQRPAEPARKIVVLRKKTQTLGDGPLLPEPVRPEDLRLLLLRWFAGLEAGGLLTCTAPHAAERAIRKLIMSLDRARAIDPGQVVRLLRPIAALPWSGIALLGSPQDKILRDRLESANELP